jgi:hypothetical protein
MKRPITAILLVAVAIAGCGNAFVVPPASAGPAVVLHAYLDGLVAGNCDAGKVLGTSTFVLGNGELCGATHVRAYSVAPGEPAMPNPNEAVFATTLTTDGSRDGSVPAGDMTWFYTLERQPDGSWRITGGGSGP